MNFETTQVAADPRARILPELAEGSTFFASLLAQYEQRGSLSPKQWACVEREQTKRINAKRQPQATTAQVEIGLVAEQLAKLGEHLKKPKLYLIDGDVEYRFDMAPATGVNAGWIYAKVEGETDWGWGWAYYAKLNPESGAIQVARSHRDWQDATAFAEVLKRIFADGLEAALYSYGAGTGNCGVCGRQLTEELSVKSGIGPVCASRLGIDREELSQ